MITPAQVDSLRAEQSEHQSLEFKEAKQNFDSKRLHEYCVAIANEGGGHLVLGVANSPPRPVVGTSAFPDVIGLARHLFEKLGFRIDVEDVAHPDGRVLVFSIPSRPKGSAYHLDGKYLMRSGESLVPMSEDWLRSIFEEGKPDWLEEPARIGLKPDEVIALLDTQSYFELIRIPYPTTQDAVIKRLTDERLVDLSESGCSIRRIGAILLAKSLTAFPDVARKAPRLIVYPGSSKLETRLDRTGSRGYAVGFQGLVRFVMSQLPRNEVIEDALRKDAELVPEIAIRELVANALIHQDFSVGGASMMIEVYSNRVEISNPGEPIVPEARFIDGYRSRNERLADLMRRFGVCEEKGSGVDKVVNAAEEYQLPAPRFWTGHQRTVATIFGPIPFDEMTRDDRVRACYQHCALRWVMSEYMTNQSLRDRFQLSEHKSAIVSQIIAATTEAGLIKLDEKIGTSRRLARYLPFWA